MDTLVKEIRDPWGIGLTLLTLAVNLALRVPALEAAAAALVVLAVRVIAGLVWPARAQPVPSQPESTPQPTTGRGPLTPREWQVAQLVPQGLSNKEIGTKLFIAERTVDNFIQHIFNKLNVHTRAEIAAWVARRRPHPDEPQK